MPRTKHSTQKKDSEAGVLVQKEAHVDLKLNDTTLELSSGCTHYGVQKSSTCTSSVVNEMIELEFDEGSLKILMR